MPENIANAVAFLVSEEAKFVTAQPGHSMPASPSVNPERKCRR
jgi:hypothetical protein